MLDATSDEPLVSVIIPTIGRDCLRTTVESVLRQTVGCEVILVLDRPEVEKEVKERLAGLAYKLLTTNGREGGSFARNTGLDKASAPYIAYLDDDDQWLPQKAEKQIAAIEASPYPDRSISVTATSFIRGHGLNVQMPREPYHSANNIADYLVTRKDLRFGRNFMQTSSILGPSGIMKDYRWDTNLPKHQDWDLFVRFGSDLKNHIIFLADALVTVNQNSESSVSKIPNWRASAVWYEKHSHILSQVGRGDFLAVHILRAALHTRSVKGIRYYLRNVRGSRAHMSAIIVGMFGFFKK
ncbi:glycosyltransferase family 2 protein [Arthrobacter mangrovi]|uniref:Glycosyltransferase 2-like domain-containing protein n=1 Tax=Arthrobacter mangrovi TaxID=2966350 RepID=A0ABQ5MWE8_9MICC|nr:glycosyltransferase family 2 protein [Arthrobacter mangrovi]GLB68298.1 hypothetical protein AHIS1636_27400 [Arthrobacter mangrovi]